MVTCQTLPQCLTEKKPANLAGVFLYGLGDELNSAMFRLQEMI